MNEITSHTEKLKLSSYSNDEGSTSDSESSEDDGLFCFSMCFKD